MRVPGRAVAPALLAVIATACSAQHHAVTPTPAAASGRAAPATASGVTAGVDPDLLKQGYRVVRRHDQVFYCRVQSITGTLFASKVCLTADQITNQRGDLQESKDLLNRAHAVQCVPPTCASK